MPPSQTPRANIRARLPPLIFVREPVSPASSQTAKMDHSDRIKQNLEILGFESLENLSLDQLLCAITNRLPSNVSRARVLNIYAMWLHSRLIVLDVSTQGNLTHEISTWYRFLKALGYEDTVIAQAFWDWQRGEAIEDATSWRRLSIAEAELRRIIFSPITGPRSASGFGGSEGHYGQMHPDRVELSREDNTVIEVEDDESDVVLVSSSTVGKDSRPSQNRARDGQPDLSFLTGSNKLALNDVANVSSGNKKNPETSQTKGKSVAAAPELHVKKAGGKKAGAPGKPRADYVCDRCGGNGHFLKECPTNMDPMFDRKPPRNYLCHFCNGVGLHFGPLCPQHPDPNSIARRRQWYTKAISLLDKDGPASSRNVPKGDHVDHSLGDSTTGRGRPKSPVRRVKWNHPRDDRLSPGFSRLRLSPTRNQQGKRRASRSPSPEKTALRKKNRTLIPKGITKGIATALALPDGISRKRKDREEGRLLYDDEEDGYVLPPSVAQRTIRVPYVEKMDIDGPENPVSVRRKDLSGFIDHRLFELDLMEMIHAESTKTDLILLINGAERMPPCSRFLVGLFKGQTSIGVNERFRKARPCPTDYFQFLVEEQEVDLDDYESVDETEASEDQEGCCMFCGGEVGDSAMMPVEPALAAATKTTDAEMVDVVASTVVSISSDEEDLVMLEARSLQVEGPPSHGLNVGSAAIATRTKDRCSARHIAQKTTRAAMVKKPYGVSNPPSLRWTSHIDLTFSPPPLLPLDDTAMEVEASPQVSRSPPASRSELFAQAIPGEVIDSRMAGAVAQQPPAFRNEDSEVIVISDSSQSSAEAS